MPTWQGGKTMTNPRVPVGGNAFLPESSPLFEITLRLQLFFAYFLLFWGQPLTIAIFVANLF